MKEIYTFSHINRLDDDMPLSCSSQLQLVCCFTFIFFNVQCFPLGAAVV